MFNKKPTTRTYFMLVTYGILLYLGLTNLPALGGCLAWFFAILQPVLYGICIAFVINLFMRFFRTRVFKATAASKKPWEQKLAGILSGICTFLVAMVLISMIVFLIIPQLTTAINTLVVKIPGSEEQLRVFILEKLTDWKAPESVVEYVRDFQLDWRSVLKFAGDLLDGKVESLLGTAFSATTSVLSTATNLIIGLIIAIYILIQKERVLFLCHKLIQLIVPQRFHKQTFRVLTLTHQSFGNFLTGQFIEALCLGSLTALGCLIFRFPYAGTIGVLQGITALLPIVGAWIGAGVGALLVWVEAPSMAFWFLVFILLLQQVDNQFIYPKIVGNTVGLPEMLVLIAVVVGGSVGGVIGIISAVPLFTIIYTLLKEAIDKMPPDPDEDQPETPLETPPDTPPEPVPVSVSETAAQPPVKQNDKKQGSPPEKRNIPAQRSRKRKK